MKNIETAQKSKLLMDIIVVTAIAVLCFLYIEHYAQIQNEANAILMSSIDDLNSGLANSSGK